MFKIYAISIVTGKQKLAWHSSVWKTVKFCANILSVRKKSLGGHGITSVTRRYFLLHRV